MISAKTMASKSKDSGEVIKNYHKQAFEYVSKALRIDEDDSGLFSVYELLCDVLCHVTACNKTTAFCYDRSERGGCAVVQKGDF